jgi:hypothetical protein
MATLRDYIREVLRAARDVELSNLDPKLLDGSARFAVWCALADYGGRSDCEAPVA